MAPAGQRGRLMAALHANTMFECFKTAQTASTNTSGSLVAQTAAAGSNCAYTNLIASAGTTATARLSAVGVTPTGQYGRPSTTLTMGDQAGGTIAFAAVGAPVNFVNENDYARISTAFRFATGDFDDIAVIIGLATPYGTNTGASNVLVCPASSTNAYNTTTVASNFNTFMGIVKPVAATPAAAAFSATFADDGTSSTAQPLGSVLASNVWYDIDVEFIKGSGTNVGAMQVTIGRDTPWEANFATPFSARIETSTLFADADASLVPVVGFVMNATTATAVSCGHFEFGAWRRPQN